MLAKRAASSPWLDRVDLVERLSVAARGRLTCVVAPAGYGKTSLLSQWRSTMEPSATVWLELDERVADPRRFAVRLGDALHQSWGNPAGAVPRPPTGNHAKGGSDADLEELLAWVCENARNQPPTVVVVDGIERLQASEREVLTAMAVHAPEALRFVVSGRHGPWEIASGGFRVSRLS